MDDKCTVMVCTCDAYEDLWAPFFQLFQTYWPDCSYPIVLNTQSKSFSWQGLDIKCFQLFSPEKKDRWGKRMLDTLRKLDTEYVLIMLDDFFIRERVEQKKIDQVIKYMDQDQRICVFSFETVLDDNNVKSEKYPGFELRPQVGKYKFNLQAAVWRREALIKAIRPHETPWEWELIANQRSSRINNLFFTSSPGEASIINYGFNNTDFDNPYRGKWGVLQGKWVVEDVDPLFKKHGIKIDYRKRGVYDPNAPAPKSTFRTKVYNRTAGSIKRRYRRWLSLR